MRDGESGVTLIEVMVGLALFALIGVTGFSVADSVLRTQRHTDGRLERLGEIQRAMHLLTLDFEQIIGPDLTYDGESVAFQRHSARGPVAMSYGAVETILQRRLDGRRAQVALRGLEAVTWRFLHASMGWVDSWPLPGDGEAALPKAIVVEMVLARGDSLSGDLRRIVHLPTGAP